jgi:TMEM175 potassium channel family protein
MTDGEKDPALQSAAPEARSGRREKRRLEAFSDGVFAIAVTLLVLELKVPATSGLPPGGLMEALRDEWPSYFAYLLSFATILIMWVNHHVLLDYVRQIDHAFLYLNGLLLLTITLVPFPTSLLARYALQPDAHLAAAVYCGLLTLIAVCFNLVWWYAAHSNRLTMPEGGGGAVTRRYMFGPLFYLVALGVAFFSVPAALLICAALAVFFALPYRPPAAERMQG